MPYQNQPQYPRWTERYDDPEDIRNTLQFRTSFASVRSSDWDPTVWDQVIKGAGMTIAQASGNGTIAAGTTANAETILRAKYYFNGAMALRARVTLSNRIVNNNFFVELVDIVGDKLAFTVNSATSVTVTIPANGPVFSNENIGQSMTLGGVGGTAIIPGRYVIAAVSDDGKSLTFTVTAGPASGSGTVSLFGWNFHRTLFDGTTATNAKYDTGRKGWSSGDTTTTIATTASPVVIAMAVEDGAAAQLDATQNSVAWTQRAARTENLPDEDVDLVLQIRVLNGTVAPAGSTTLTVGFVSVETSDPLIARIGSQAGFSGANQISLAPFQTVDIVRVNGSTIATSNGTVNAQTIRVVLASDQTTNTNPLLVGGTGSTSIGKARDGAAGGTDTGVPAMLIRRDVPTALTPAAGDYEVPQISANGEVWTVNGGASSSSHTVSAASTNATSSKASAGVLHDVEANNLNAAARYLKLYDKASAPTVGTDTPKRVIPLVASSIGASTGRVLDLRFGTGIAWALTSGIANSDTGAVGANEHVVGLSWF